MTPIKKCRWPLLQYENWRSFIYFKIYTEILTPLSFQDITIQYFNSFIMKHPVDLLSRTAGLAAPFVSGFVNISSLQFELTWADSLSLLVVSVLCTVYCVLCTVYCVLCTVYCVLCTGICDLGNSGQWTVIACTGTKYWSLWDN